MIQRLLNARLNLIGYAIGVACLALGLMLWLDQRPPSGPLKTVEGTVQEIDSISFPMFRRTTFMVVNPAGETFTLRIALDGDALGLKLAAHVTALADETDRVFDLTLDSKHVIDRSTRAHDTGTPALIWIVPAGVAFGWALFRDRRRRLFQGGPQPT